MAGASRNRPTTSRRTTPHQPGSALALPDLRAVAGLATGAVLVVAMAVTVGLVATSGRSAPPIPLPTFAGPAFPDPLAPPVVETRFPDPQVPTDGTALRAAPAVRSAPPAARVTVLDRVSGVDVPASGAAVDSPALQPAVDAVTDPPPAAPAFPAPPAPPPAPPAQPPAQPPAPPAQPPAPPVLDTPPPPPIPADPGADAPHDAGGNHGSGHGGRATVAAVG